MVGVDVTDIMRDEIIRLGRLQDVLQVFLGWWMYCLDFSPGFFVTDCWGLRTDMMDAER